MCLWNHHHNQDKWTYPSPLKVSSYPFVPCSILSPLFSISPRITTDIFVPMYVFLFFFLPLTASKIFLCCCFKITWYVLVSVSLNFFWWALLYFYKIVGSLFYLIWKNLAIISLNIFFWFPLSPSVTLITHISNCLNLLHSSLMFTSFCLFLLFFSVFNFCSLLLHLHICFFLSATSNFLLILIWFSFVPWNFACLFVFSIYLLDCIGSSCAAQAPESTGLGICSSWLSCSLACGS